MRLKDTDHYVGDSLSFTEKDLSYDGRQDLDIRWNIFNLASGAETHDDGSLTLARLSDGTLLSQQTVSGDNATGKRYCGSFVFTTGTGITTPQVESVAWDEGRIFRDAQTGTYRDCWFAGDHLGNVRSVLDITPDVTGPVPLEQNDYLPFGTKIANPLHAQMGTNRWRYAGKEEFPNLNLLDFGARMYDPFTARWTAVDPIAGKYTSTSPYVYCAGNPVTLVDRDGEKIIFVNGFSQWWFKYFGKLSPGKDYWDQSIVKEAQYVLKDKKVFFTNKGFGILQNASLRRRQGYEYAQEHYEQLMENIEEGESFKFVTHSMGASFGEGMADYLREKNQKVDVMLHFAPFQASEIEANPSSDVLTIDIQTIGDKVLKLGSKGTIKNAKTILLPAQGSGDKHTDSLGHSEYWKKIREYINEFLNMKSE